MSITPPKPAFFPGRSLLYFFLLALVMSPFPSVPGALAANNLPPDVQLDILAAELAKAIETDDHKAVVAGIERLRSGNYALPANLMYAEARSRAALGKHLEARNLLESYISKEGRKGKYYDAVVALYAEIKDKAASQEAEQRRQAELAAEQDRKRKMEEQRQEEIRLAAARKAEEERRRIEEKRRRAEEANAAFAAALVQVGTVSRVNNEYGYAVVALLKEHDFTSGYLLALPPDTARAGPVELKVGKRNDEALMVTASQLGRLRAGVSVYWSPTRSPVVR